MSTVDHDEFGRTKLHYVCVDLPLVQHTQETCRLIELGFDPNAQDKNGWTPLHFAAQEWSESAAQELISHGAEVDRTDVFGNTPLWRAVFSSKGRGELIKLLLAAGANPNIKNHHGVSAIELANTIGNYHVSQHFQKKT